MKPYYTLTDLLSDADIINQGHELPAKLAVIGDPIAHSKSPLMQQAALNAAKINARYIRIQASPDEFDHVIKTLQTKGFIGANVTIPHKQRAYKLCTNADSLAKATEAVNTLVFENDGSVSGFNTDGPGFAYAIRDEFSMDLRDLKIVLLGACGGTGLALAYTCAMNGCERLTLAGRSAEKLNSLKSSLSHYFQDENRLSGSSDRLAAYENNTPRFNEAVADAELIINATSLGLKSTDGSPLPIHLLEPYHLIYDLQTHSTTLQQEAYQKGARAVNGISMLVYQGALAFERWFGIKPDVRAMQQALKNV